MNYLKWKGLDIDPRQITESVHVKPNILAESTQLLQESASGIQYLLPRIEAIHAGTTRNNTRYLADKLRGHAELKSGAYSWTQPYPKPVIFNHDQETRATGRVYNAQFSEYTVAGRPGLIVVPKITDKRAIQDIMGGLLLTVSIGATTDSAVCSFCGTDILEEGFCGHHKGESYEGTTVEWIAGNLWFDELSWVNVPADSDAMITDPGQIVVAEAFAFAGKDLVDLGRNRSEWVLSKEAALAEGLMISSQEKGDIALTKEELQAKVQGLEEANTELTAKNTELTTQVEEASKMIQAKEAELLEKATELDTVKSELVEKTAALETKDSELAEQATALETTKTEVTAVKEELQATQVEKTSLLEKNASLVADAHTLLAERVADLRLSLGKEASREEAIEELAKRSTESLKDSLADLLKESVKAPIQRQVAPVENPGIGNVEEGANTETKITKEEALKNLFSGPAFTKK